MCGPKTVYFYEIGPSGACCERDTMGPWKCLVWTNIIEALVESIAKEIMAWNRPTERYNSKKKARMQTLFHEIGPSAVYPQWRRLSFRWVTHNFKDCSGRLPSTSHPFQTHTVTASLIYLPMDLKQIPALFLSVFLYIPHWCSDKYEVHIAEVKGFSNN